MVKRYEVNWHDGEYLPYESDDGRFTLHTDYAKLEAERDRLKQSNADSQHDMDRLIAERDALRGALERGRLAIGEHSAPEECYATGPLTGCAIQDLIVCPACAFIDAYDDINRTALGGG